MVRQLIVPCPKAFFLQSVSHNMELLDLHADIWLSFIVLVIALFTPVIEHTITIIRDIADRLVFVIASFFSIK